MREVQLGEILFKSFKYRGQCVIEWNLVTVSVNFNFLVKDRELTLYPMLKLGIVKDRSG